MTFNTHWVIVCDMVIGPMNVVEIELKLDLIRLSSKVMPSLLAATRSRVLEVLHVTRISKCRHACMTIQSD